MGLYSDLDCDLKAAEGCVDEQIVALVKAGYRVEILGDGHDPLPFRVIISDAREGPHTAEPRRYRIGSFGFGCTIREALDDARSRISTVWIPNKVQRGLDASE